MKLRDLLDASVPQFARPLSALAAAHAKHDLEAAQRAEIRLAKLIAETRTVADMLGRENLYRQLNMASGPVETFADIPAALMDQPTYLQAVKALLKRTPRLIGSFKDAAAVQAANGIAFAKAASMAVAQKVQEALAGALAVGQGRSYFTDLLAYITPWTDAYAETVYRTNLSGAYTKAQFELAEEPEVSDLFAGWRFSATMDADTRPNHAACHGVLARVDDPVWDSIRPPLGYNCRCGLVAYTNAQAKRDGRLRGGLLPWARLPVGAGPDQGFNNV